MPSKSGVVVSDEGAESVKDGPQSKRQDSNRELRIKSQVSFDNQSPKSESGANETAKEVS